MENRQADGSVTGEPVKLAAMGGAVAGSKASSGSGDDSREGDVIRGLRSGLIFSLAIWALLLTVGTVLLG